MVRSGVLVSVIVPVYNAEQYLKRCLDSLLSQTHRLIEVILINDGSTDSGGSLCDHYATIDSRVKVFHQNNTGPSTARNVGLEQAKGKYLMFVDADDFVDIDIVRLLLEAHESRKAGLTVCTYISHLFKGTIELGSTSFDLNSASISVDEFLSLDTLDRENSHAVRARAHITGNIWGRLYSADIIRRNRLLFNSKLTRYEDVLFNLAYISHINDILVLNQNLYHYCVYTDRNSLSDRVTKNKTAMLTISYEAVCHYLGNRQSDYIKYYFAYLIIGNIIRLFQADSPFSFKKAYHEVKTISSSKVYRNTMACYYRPKGASILIPFFLKAKLYLLASIAAKIRMLKTSLKKEPIRSWCFSGNAMSKK